MSGKRTPLLRIDSASSSLCDSSKCRRGWCLLGRISSMPRFITPLRSAGDPPGMRAPRPLPSAGRFTCALGSFKPSPERLRALAFRGTGVVPLQHLLCELQVALRALGLDVVEDRRAAVAGRLREPDVAWDQ